VNPFTRTIDAPSPAQASSLDDSAAQALRSPVSEPLLRAGTKLGRWTIGRELGRGGVAVVYQALDEDLHRTLAIKTLSREKLARRDDEAPAQHERRVQDARRRMRREAELTAGLDHPGIPPVHAVGQLTDGRPYFCMRLIAGQTLAQILRERPGDRAEHLRIFGQVAEIVAAAHESRVIHRDLKPGNVMVGRFGEVQVMDWGMAKKLESSGETSSLRRVGDVDDSTATVALDESEVDEIAWDDSEADEISLSRLLASTSVELGQEETAPGAVLGTFAYMPPEQAAGRSCEHDARTDVFALGAILCQILIGRPPYRGQSSDELWRQARAASLKPVFDALEALDADAQLVSLCQQSLAAQPEHRPASALEVAERMRDYHSSVATRLQQAEIERAAAVARAAEAQRRAEVERSRRRVAVALFSSLVALVLLVVGAIVAFQWQSARYAARAAQAQRDSDRARAQTLAAVLLDGPAAGVPFAIEDLQPLSEYARPLLTQAVSDEQLDPPQRLHAACALAAWGHVDPQFLVDSIATAPGDELANISRALNVDRTASLAALARQRAAVQGQAPLDLALLARIAIVALHLGDATHFSELAAHRAHPAPRTVLTDILRSWHGDLTLLPIEDMDGAGLSVLCTGLAEIPSTELSRAERGRWGKLAAEWHLSTNDAGLHSASGMLLRRWNLPVPTLADKGDKPQCPWRVNSLGMTLLKIPSGSFFRAASSATSEAQQKVEISQPFWLSDRETSTGQFLIFLDDDNYPPADKPNPNAVFQHLRRDAAFADRPAREISWHDAILFCNWLSRRENLQPYYRHAEDDWQRSDESVGYRLPTEAEWEYAARAGSTTVYSHGDSLADLRRYAIFSQREPAACGDRAPNAFGLFDMHGNVQEWCYDSWRDDYGDARSVRDPIVSLLGRRHVVRGGSFFHHEDFLASAARRYGDAVVGDVKNGFRVARNTLPSER
jgi:formylglycine-generating enzyme required for sulfatase activity/serine/threonine protein kinase